MENNNSYKRRRDFRVGVDLDRVSRFKLLKTYFNAKHFFPNAQVKVDETGHGHHIRIFQAGLSPETNMAVRRHLGDDWGRLRFDELRLHVGLLDWIDTLFQVKCKDGKWTREEETDPLSEPFYSKMPAYKKGKVKRKP